MGIRRVQYLPILIVLITAIGCTPDHRIEELTDAEAHLATAVGLDIETAQLIRTYGQSLSRLTGLDEDWQKFNADGVLLTTPANRGDTVLKELRAALENTPYTAYLHDQGFGYSPDTIAILANPDPFYYLQIVRINGVNSDIEHPDVIERLRSWDEQYGLKLIGGGMDWLLAEFENPPSDWNAYATEVYRFCPDVVDQGTGSVVALAAELQRINGVYLWWD